MLIYANWWKLLSTEQQLYWSIAIVSTTLAMILYILSYFRVEQDKIDPKVSAAEKRKYLITHSVILFLVTFSWIGVLFSYLELSTTPTLLYGLGLGLITALFYAWLFRPSPGNSQLQVENTIDHTGRVLQIIPPHRNGFGRIRLKHNEIPYEIEAITAGNAIPKGSQIKIIEVLDGEIVLVEALQKQQNNLNRFKDNATRQEIGKEFLNNQLPRRPE
ncbi:MAG: hypothetical protein AAFO07_28630 [Bacteroidota bacterium]